MHYISGSDRQQSEFFTRLDDMIPAQHYGRLIDLLADCFVKENSSLFEEKGRLEVGRKAYHPSLLLKLYLYGYLNSISSSRKLERECHRNIEMMWLMTRLAPDHKTIADFRRQNGEAIRLVLLKFNQLLKDSGYIKGKIISIDGSKIRANAGMYIDLSTIESRLVDLEAELTKYMAGLDHLDQTENELVEMEEQKVVMTQQVETLKQEIQQLQKQKAVLENTEAKKLSLTDPDARIMQSRHGRHLSYNLQAVVDAENHMIVCSTITNLANDRNQLTPMVEQVERDLSVTPEKVIADAGYYVLNQIEHLEKERGIECFVPISHNQQQLREIEAGIEFSYDSTQDIYTCSQGQELHPNYGIKRDRRRNTEAKIYQGVNCTGCPVKPSCTASEKGRSIARQSNQEWKDQYLLKMKSTEGKEKMRLRRMLSEHPFGTIKYWMGQIPLLTRGLRGVQTEVTIYTIAYNFRRWLSLESFDNMKERITGFNWKLA
jgi:transposase